MCTDKKEKRKFSSYIQYKEIQKGAVAKSYMTNGLLIYMVKYSVRIRIRIWIRIHMFLGLPDPDPLVKCMDPDPDPALDPDPDPALDPDPTIIMQK